MKDQKEVSGTARSPRKKKETLTAYHEAGHAVACYQFHIRFNYVTIIPTKEMDGSIGILKFGSVLKGDRSSRASAQMERRIMTSLAGPVAERLLRVRGPKSLPRKRVCWDPADRWSDGYSGDWESITGLIKYFSDRGDVSRSHLQYLYERTRELLLEPDIWSAVEALAAELLNRKKIGYREARKTIREALGEYRRKNRYGFNFRSEELDFCDFADWADLMELREEVEAWKSRAQGEETL